MSYTPLVQSSRRHIQLPVYCSICQSCLLYVASVALAVPSAVFAAPAIALAAPITACAGFPLHERKIKRKMSETKRRVATKKIVLNHVSACQSNCCVLACIGNVQPGSVMSTWLESHYVMKSTCSRTVCFAVCS
jgi:uncharacterized membrane protein